MHPTMFLVKFHNIIVENFFIHMIWTTLSSSFFFFFFGEETTLSFDYLVSTLRQTLCLISNKKSLFPTIMGEIPY